MDGWEGHRRYLFAVAYRLLGSAADAEDAVQEAYLRLRGAAPADLVNPRAWLTTVTSRICLDMLGSARARREAYVGTWLPEPLVGYDDTDLGDTVALRDSLRSRPAPTVTCPNSSACSTRGSCCVPTAGAWCPPRASRCTAPSGCSRCCPAWHAGTPGYG